MAMGSDSVSKASPIPAFSKDSVNNKKKNRLAKLKRSKPGGRREQWISHGKNKSDEVDSNGMEDASSPPTSDKFKKAAGEIEDQHVMGVEKKHEIPITQRSESLPFRSRSVGNGGTYGPITKDSRGRSSSSSSGCSSGSTSEEDRDDEVHDWEAVADALNIENVQLPLEAENNCRPDGCKFANSNSLADDLEDSKVLRRPLLHSSNTRAWRPDDAFRPQGLPSINKHHVGVANGRFPVTVKQQVRVVNSEHHGTRGRTWSSWRKTAVPHQPSSCPICCEDLDVTDCSFCPCPCGFQLCLFCHKRIREDDGRCPGCRKQYDAVNLGTCFVIRAPAVRGSRRQFQV